MVFLSMVGGSLREGGTYDLVHAQDTDNESYLSLSGGILSVEGARRGP